MLDLPSLGMLTFTIFASVIERFLTSISNFCSESVGNLPLGDGIISP